MDPGFDLLPVRFAGTHSRDTNRQRGLSGIQSQQTIPRPGPGSVVVGIADTVYTVRNTQVPIIATRSLDIRVCILSCRGHLTRT